MGKHPERMHFLALGASSPLLSARTEQHVDEKTDGQNGRNDADNVDLAEEEIAQLVDDQGNGIRKGGLRH